MQHDEHLVVKAQDEPIYSLARERRAYFPQAVFKTSYQRSPNWPAELHPHKVQSGYATVFLVETTQPIGNRRPTCFRLVKPYGYLRASFLSIHYSIMYHKWYILRREVPFTARQQKQR